MIIFPLLSTYLCYLHRVSIRFFTMRLLLFFWTKNTIIKSQASYDCNFHSSLLILSSCKQVYVHKSKLKFEHLHSKVDLFLNVVKLFERRNQ